MFEYPIEWQRLHWRHVYGEQWHMWRNGIATGYGEFRDPPSGVYVIIGGKGKLEHIVMAVAQKKTMQSLGLKRTEDGWK
jgi:hypothetical protein